MTSSFYNTYNIKQDEANENLFSELLQLTDSVYRIGRTRIRTYGERSYQNGLHITIIHRDELVRECNSLYYSEIGQEAYDTVLQDAIECLLILYRDIIKTNDIIT